MRGPGASFAADAPGGLDARHRMSGMFVAIGVAATVVGFAMLIALLYQLISQGGHHLNGTFFTSFPSSDPARAGVFPAWVGSLLVILTTAVVSVPLGVLAGLYLEEYAPRNAITSAIEIAVNNLASVPSIIFGLLALGLFIQTFGWGKTILTGGVTLALLILPIVIVATREAVRAVPQDLRLGALALGATKWQTTQDHVLPNALPGVITGVIIALSRAIGETAPLIAIGIAPFVPFLPITLPGDPLSRTVGALDEFGAPLDPTATEMVTLDAGGEAIDANGLNRIEIPPGVPTELPHGATYQAPAEALDVVASWSPTSWLGQEFTVLPIQMFNWSGRPDAAFIELAAAAGLVLFVITLALNTVAIWLRYRLRKRLRW